MSLFMTLHRKNVYNISCTEKVLSQVNSHVDLEVTIVRKRFHTYFTLKRSFSGMNSLVDIEVTSLTELLIALMPGTNPDPAFEKLSEKNFVKIHGLDLSSQFEVDKRRSYL